MKPSAAIADARVIANDPGVTPRYSDALLLGYFNDFMKELAKRKRELFHEISEITLVAGEFQAVSRSLTNGLVDIIRNTDKQHVRKVSRQDIEQQAPRWRRATISQKPINWCWVVAQNEFDFMVYPAAVAADKLLVVVANVPADVAIGSIGADIAQVSDNYRAAAASYVAGRAIAINTSSVDVQKGITLVNTGLSMI